MRTCPPPGNAGCVACPETGRDAARGDARKEGLRDRPVRGRAVGEDELFRRAVEAARETFRGALLLVANETVDEEKR
ncbi:hypothetical protein TRIP_B250277 [uncultured Desulfatiglans sp.]|uniref:Uncharacterized protein n=1 Tax=Uncultured Desulfatiglans sp. TaxID=1748965 RepID=A0A653A6A7_UNCDX|nr:hypothetical protein TRIP_B250277 [uncultured Desulfatiglans sp.]